MQQILRRPKWVLGGTLLALILALISACASPPDTQPAAEEEILGHIHGLGVDPDDDTLYVAAHVGLFRVDGSGSATRVADRWQDTMAFTVTGPNTFLASGHPDLREGLPGNLGLIQSKDAGVTWTALARQGRSDFHLLEMDDGILYAFDATTSQLLRTEDLTRFETLVEAPLLSVTALPTARESLLAAYGEGELMRLVPKRQTLRAVQAPPTVLLDTTVDGSVVGLGPDGTVRVSETDGRTWRTRGSLAGAPVALTTSEAAWYAATNDGVFRSDDDGVTWQKVL